MNILLVSHAAWRHTGYSTLTRLFCSELPKHGHKVAVLAVEERGPAKMYWDGILHYLAPQSNPMGESVAEVCAQDFGAKMIISIIDPWALSRPLAFNGVDWIAWCAVDQTPPQRGLADILKSAKLTVAFSEWGRGVLSNASPDLNVKAIHGGIDLNLFRDLGDNTRASLKEQTSKIVSGIAKPFVVGMAGTNLPYDRKALRENIAGFAEFAANCPEAILLLWTTEAGGVHLPSYIDQFEARDRILLCSPWEVHYSTEGGIVGFYNTLDILLHASAAEGFGLPIVEANACGIPVIVNDYSSMPELVIDRTGWIVGAGVREWSRLGGWWKRPDPADIANKLRLAHSDITGVGTDRPMKFDCAGWAKQFDWTLIGQQWAEVLE